MLSMMSPDASPGTPSGATQKNSGVRRVNNLPIYIGLGIMAVFVLIMAIVASNRAEQQNVTNDDEVTEVETTNLLANIITGDYKGDGIIESKSHKTQLPAVSDTTQDILIARPDNLDLPPLPPGSQAYQETNPDIEYFRQLKMQQFEEAVKSGISVTMTPAERADSSTRLGSTGGTPGRDGTQAKRAAIRAKIDSLDRESPDPTATYLSKLQQIREDINPGGGGFGDDSAPHLLDTNTNRPNNNYSEFDGTGQGERWDLDSQPKAPVSPYSLFPGFVIPAILISGINSDLPGQIMAQVSQDIYDTPVGKHRLIPQGSRLVGSYSNDVAFGQKRVLVAWQRIVFPDGKTMDIGAMAGADSLGQSGFNDQVDNHYFRIFGSALLMSAVIAGATYSQRDAGGGGSFGRQNAGSILSQSLGQQLGQATARLLNKNLNIAPTLQIRPGFRFNVVVTKDMVFSKPYQSLN